MSRVHIAAALAAVISIPALAQAPAPQKAPDSSQTAGQYYKNVQVLKDIPADELVPAMRFIGGALGVECEFCHTGGNSPEDRAKDDKKNKQTAREMMKMMKNINDTSFAGRTEVTCATCHQGNANPRGFAPVATPETIKARLAEEANRPRPQGQGQPGAGNQPAGGQAANAQALPPVPAADQLFAKYEEAIGGDAAISKLTSEHVVGTMTLGNGQTIKAEQYSVADGNKLWNQVGNERFSRTTGFDGQQAWAKDREAHPLIGLDAQQTQMQAQFYRNMRLKDLYTQARTIPHKDKIGDKDVYVVRAAVKGGRFMDMLYFDANSGLLLRRTTLTRTALGPMPLVVDYDNYTEHDGVKVATDYTQSTPQNITKVHLDEVKFNVPVDSAKFAMPSDGQPAK